MNEFWLEPVLGRWQNMIAKGIKPQAVVVQGVPGMGKKALTEHVMAAMLCSHSDTEACGHCQNCRLLAAGHHPDVMRVSPDKDIIKVDQIRQLTAFYTSTPHCSQHKLALISDAHLMNTSAANALLKVLEEPPVTGTLFLLTDAKHRLLPTIRSRCIGLDVTLDKQATSQMVDWLKQMGHDEAHIKMALPLVDFVPLAAQSIIANDDLGTFMAWLQDLLKVLNNQAHVTQIANQWSDGLNREVLLMWQRWLLFVLKHGRNSEFMGPWQKHEFILWLNSQPQSVDLLIGMNDLLMDFVLNFNTQVKRQLMLESMLISLLKIKQR